MAKSSEGLDHQYGGVMSDWLPKRLPEDLDAERALLATLAAPNALDPESSFAQAHQAILSLAPEHFIHPAHRAILRAIRTLYAEAEEVNPLTLKAALERHGTLGLVGDYPGLIDLLSSEEVGKPMVLVDRLIDLWRARQVIRYGAEAVRCAASREKGISDLISELSGKLAALSVGRDVARIRSASAMLDRLKSREAFRDPGEAGGKAAWIGLPDLDEEIEASPKHVVIIAARPGIGKSALAIQGLWHTARCGLSSLLISLEMDTHEVEARLAAWLSGEGQRRFRDGTYTDTAVWNLSREELALQKIHTWAHPSGVAWSKVEAVIRDAVRVHGVSCVWIDHVLLLGKPSLGKGVNEAACWTALSRSIKRLAQELQICIVSLCQLNREGEGVEPKLSDLKESGGWEEDANAVVMLWPKDPKANEGRVENKPVFVKVAKNRSGAGFFKRELSFQGATNRFSVVERTTEDVQQAMRRRFR